MVVLLSQDKIDVAVSCMHHRAFDYVVKSETAFVRLQKIITTFSVIKNGKGIELVYGANVIRIAFDHECHSAGNPR